MNLRRIIIWFRNDLRLHDNPIVHEAATVLKKCRTGPRDGNVEVVPMYCFDKSFFGENILDYEHQIIADDPKMGRHRAHFALQCVLDLRKSLREIGSDLLVFYDTPESALQGLLHASGRNIILTMEESTYEERAVDRRVRAAVAEKATLKTLWSHTLFHIDDLPFNEDLSNLPDTFTPARKSIEAKCTVRKALPTPNNGDLGTLPDGMPVHAQVDAEWDRLPLDPKIRAQGIPQPHPKGAFPFEGGETAALKRLKYYVWEKNLIAEYFETRNGMLGADYSSKFSPWLALGCLSPRTIYHEIRQYEATRIENKSTYWLIFELIWRDYFRFFAVKHGPKLFLEGGVIDKKLPWTSDSELFNLWKEGRTGMPLVDANMRELACTGFMSNRGRQNVASYLVLDMGVDWRRGAAWFENTLLDHDVTSNYGNWVSAAGLTGGRINKFNIVKQSKDYDAEGCYLRHWLPELENVPVQYVHEPWTMPQHVQKASGCVIGEQYPEPVPARRLARPWGGARFPDVRRNEQYNSRIRPGARESRTGTRGQKHGRVPAMLFK